MKDAGKISHEIACDKALTEFEKYRVKQDKLYKSDFDLLVEESSKVGDSNGKWRKKFPKRKYQLIDYDLLQPPRETLINKGFS